MDLLRLARRGHPLLLVDREVELVRPPVLALPERVELAVVEQAAAVADAALGLVARVALARSAVPPSAYRSRAPLLQLALLLLALQLGVVAALGAVDPAPQQGHRVDLALDHGQLVLHRLRRAHLARGHALVGVERDARACRPRRAPAPRVTSSGSPSRTLDVPGAAAVARHLVADREVVARGPLWARPGTASVRYRTSGSSVPPASTTSAIGTSPDIWRSRMRPPPLAPDAQPAAHHQAERAGVPGHEVDERARVGLEPEVGVVGAVGLVHAGATAGDRHPPRARAPSTSSS